MSTTSPRVGIKASYNPDRLFFLSCMSLIAAAWVFSIRADIMADLGKAFGLTFELVGAAVGAHFMGFAISVFIGSPLCDFLGMKRLLALAALCHVGGVLLTIFAPGMTGTFSALALLTAAQAICGLAHGLVEAVINPLAATIYPDNKTHKLNVLHAWWPGGLVMGGLLAYGMGKMGLGWEIKFAMVMIPTAIYAFMLIGQDFPPTERVASGVSNTEMVQDALKPAFWVVCLCMLFTASLELAPGQWVNAVLSKTVHFSGILVLVYVSMLMFIFRFFAGSLAHKFSPVGLMCISSVLAGVGLYGLSLADSPVTGILAATVWGFGVCFMWPTMLGITSERFPKGGALTMGLVGSVGNFIIVFALGWIGHVYDLYTKAALPAGSDLADMAKQAATNPAVQATLDQARTTAAPMAFRFVGLAAIFPLIAFGIWWMIDKQKGGYQAVKLTQADPADFSTDAVLETDGAAVRR